MDTSSLMEQILSNENLNRAYLQVVRNKGAEGVDGMKYTELKEPEGLNGTQNFENTLTQALRTFVTTNQINNDAAKKHQEGAKRWFCLHQSEQRDESGHRTEIHRCTR